MSKSTFFMNNGIFDVKSALVFGVSVKENDHAIGHFGSGFKYAVAIILRLNGSIKVTTGGEEFIFEKVNTTVRGKTFEMVTCNGEQCGFTTRMGINWEPWAAYRELSCNAADEFGSTSFEYEEHDTVIEVCCDRIARAHYERDLHFISGRLIGEYHNVEIYDRQSNSIYYQGVEVVKLDKPSKYSYNIKCPIDLTEDRTAKCLWTVNYYVQRCMQEAEDKTYVEAILDHDDDETYEDVIGFDVRELRSDTFVEVALEKHQKGEEMDDVVDEMIQKHIDATGRWEEYYLSSDEMKMYEEAADLLDGVDVDIKACKVNFVVGLGGNAMERVHNGEINLSDTLFDHDIRQIAITMLESYVKLDTGSREYGERIQDWLLNKIVSLSK